MTTEVIFRWKVCAVEVTSFRTHRDKLPQWLVILEVTLAKLHSDLTGTTWLCYFTASGNCTLNAGHYCWPRPSKRVKYEQLIRWLAKGSSPGLPKRAGKRGCCVPFPTGEQGVGWAVLRLPHPHRSSWAGSSRLRSKLVPSKLANPLEGFPAERWYTQRYKSKQKAVRHSFNVMLPSTKSAPEAWYRLNRPSQCFNIHVGSTSYHGNRKVVPAFHVIFFCILSIVKV